jgi:hypothetical protein
MLTLRNLLVQARGLSWAIQARYTLLTRLLTTAHLGKGSSAAGLKDGGQNLNLHLGTYLVRWVAKTERVGYLSDSAGLSARFSFKSSTFLLTRQPTLLQLPPSQLHGAIRHATACWD